MGKGDIKSRKGKLSNHSFGVRRPHKTTKPAEAASTEKAPKAAKK